MANPQSSSAAPSHPGPARRQVSAFALWFGLLAAPLAWAADELLLYYIASRLCASQAANDTAEMLGRATSPWFTVVSVAALLIALAGVWVAYDSWNKSAREKQGSEHHLLEVGEGRTRFLAMCGLLTSVSFAVGFLFIFSQLWVAPLC